MKNIFSIKTLLSVFYLPRSCIGWWNMGMDLTIHQNEIPNPRMTWLTFKEVIQNPMQDDPDVKGIGTKLLSSLERVGIGLGWAA
jgi:nitrate/nitrite transport system permease protein